MGTGEGRGRQKKTLMRHRFALEVKASDEVLSMGEEIESDGDLLLAHFG
jgi:hypothetical protein